MKPVNCRGMARLILIYNVISLSPYPLSRFKIKKTQFAFMKKEEMDKLVGKELDHIPRGLRGSPQNSLRLYYSGMRKTSLRGDAVTKLTKEDVLLQAINELKKSNPDFKPLYDLEFFVIKDRD